MTQHNDKQLDTKVVLVKNPDGTVTEVPVDEFELAQAEAEAVEANRPVDATGAPLETVEAQTYESEESQTAPASSVSVITEETFEPDAPVSEDNVDAFGVRRTFTDEGYVVEEYTQALAPEDNDLEVVNTPEDNDLEK